MKVGSGARWEAQVGVTLEPSLCRRLAGTALQNSQNTDHIHVSCSGSACPVSPSSVPPQPPSVGGRKARKRVRAQGTTLRPRPPCRSPNPACACAVYPHSSTTQQAQAQLTCQTQVSASPSCLDSNESGFRI